ncbi:STAS domain-containing protein [Tenuibacillus multivorans]|uniref:RsbT co-antagonist protein RsbR n=1 Tax=Tenuibacillus multivorans TaxID=237069 RepID=A0A1H0BAJ2_9BACI|nr:STAS domain-containing protein [Tenuibacillus multivorans]GEL78773.1 modulator protein RsbR [Tenuibacillus multivorans]SDN42648.1 rsbT co-antagonist protein RsbR [Tenuibacillus multivorans]
MNPEYKDILLDYSDEIIKKWMDDLEDNKLKEYKSTVSNELIEQVNREFVNLIFSKLKDGVNYESLEQFSERIVNLGWPLAYLTEGMQSFRSICIRTILEQIDNKDEAFFLEVMDDVNNWVDPIKNQLINEYSNNWNNIISLQKVALQELSVPLIPVMEGITVMPLVGTIDTDRAKLIMENLLDGVIKSRAEVVLIDITGVPVVDTMVAHHIVQAAEAVRLIGSTCILVGIRPEIAQTIVNLGIDLSRFPTKSSLKKGFEKALEMTNRDIVNVKEKDADIIDDMVQSIDKE